MKVKAKVSFVGSFNMIEGEIKECSDKATLKDLLNAGYIEVIEEEKAEVVEDEKVEEVVVEDEKAEKAKKTTKKVVKENENK